MKKLIIKELREHANLGIPALVILGLLVYPKFRTFQVTQFNLGVGIQPLLSAFILNGTAITLAVFGLILGWRQIQSEKQRDLWAFLIHRPISRTGIFSSKVIAGLSIYLVSSILPLLFFVFYVRQPGRVLGPFEWAMALPLVANVMAGIMWYFAGVLSCLRNARKLGTATAPFAATLVINLFAIQMHVFPEFYQSAVILLFGIGILGFASWGAFLSNELLKPQPLISKFSLSCTLTVFGFVVIWILGALLVFATGHGVVRMTDYYQMRKDGSILRVRVETNHGWKITGVDGSDAIDPSTGKLLTPSELAPMTAASTLLPYPSKREYREPGWQNPDRFFKQWQFQDGLLWFWVRNGELEEYDARTCLLVGKIRAQSAPGSLHAGHEGFLPNPSAGRPGNEELPYLASASDVYEIDLNHKSAKRVYSCEASDSIEGIVRMPGDKLGVLTEKLFAILNNQGSELYYIPMKPEWEFAHKQVYSLGKEGDFALWITPQSSSRTKSNLAGPEEVYYFGERAGGQKMVVVPRIPFVLELGNQEKAFSILYPFLIMAISQKIVPFANILIVMSGVGGILCACIGWVMGRKYQFSERSQWGWLLFHLLFGFSGLIAFFGLNEWPMRVRCKGCGKLRPIDNETCGCCGQAFETATAAGIEILEASPV